MKPDAAVHAQGQANTRLASWNDGAAKQAILAFARRVTTDGSPEFVPGRHARAHVTRPHGVR